jgi:hypothetical protein
VIHPHVQLTHEYPTNKTTQQTTGGLGLSPPAHLHLSTTLPGFFSFAVSPSLFQMYEPLSGRGASSYLIPSLCE